MNQAATAILEALQQVEAQRARRDADPVLGARVLALKHYQHQRFERTYVDLLSDERYAPAARFFLEELYGPRDYSARDAQFARVVPALVRLFPEEVVHTVRTLSELHALSESLDSDMSSRLADAAVNASQYVLAWQGCGREPDRRRQIDLTLEVGRALDGYTRNPWLRNSLRMMRGPARMAGLSELQQFLEAGFDTFREMRGAKSFLDILERRERTLAARLFASDAIACATTASRSDDDALGQLP